MDIKIAGITEQILTEALAQAKTARLEILKVLTSTINKPRKELSKYAPKIESFVVKVDKIREVIGRGGEAINKIIDETGVKIDITEEGLVSIFHYDADKIAQAKKIIEDIVRDVEVGETYLGKVVRIEKFGAFVNLLPGKDALVHISQLAKKHVQATEDVVKLGDEILVKVVEIDNKGRVNASRKELLED
jgi:polyribonucleotide nucleotidyltransferase